MSLSHRHLTVDHHRICCIYYPVDYRIGDRAVIFRIRIYSFVPAFGLILGAEYHRLFDPCFDDLQQIVCIIRSQLSDKPFIKDQQIYLLVSFDDFGKFSVRPCNGKFIKQSTKFVAQDDKNECDEGDTVRIMETRPLSATKRWRLVEIVEKVK